MRENRGSFRVDNPGTIKAKYGDQELGLLNISLGGTLLVPGDTHLSDEGVIELIVNHFSMKVPYNVLRKVGDNVIITFNLDDPENHLLSVLKNVRLAAESAHQHPEEASPHQGLPKVERFTRLDSVHAIRLYTMAQQFQKVGHANIELDYLRLILGVDMLTTHASYTELRENIIEPAVKEINQKTDLNISYTEIKNDEDVIALRFAIVPVIS